MSKLKCLLLLMLLTNVSFGQKGTLTNPQLRIDYWLSKYAVVTEGEEYLAAQAIFQKLLHVADQPIGVLPELYIISDLKLGQVLALPDGSIILPVSTLAFCQKEPEHFAARLAFILGHELKHVVKGDYWRIQTILKFWSGYDNERHQTNFQDLWEKIQWEQILQNREAIELEADEFGVLYASLAGYDVQAIISDEHNFITDYLHEAGAKDSENGPTGSEEKRHQAVLARLASIFEYLDLFDFGNYLYSIDEYTAAVDLFRKFVQNYPSKEVFNNLGLCYYQQAFNEYREMNRHDSDKDPLLVFRVSASLAPASGFQLSKPATRGKSDRSFQASIDKAIAFFEMAKAKDGRFKTALNNLGCANLLKGEVDFAKGFFKKAMELDPYYTEAYNNLGVTFFVAERLKKDNTRKALTHFLAALSIQEDYPEAIYNLGQWHWQQGQLAEARKYFRAYLRLDKTSVYAQVVRPFLSDVPQNDAIQKTLEQEKVNGLSPSQLFTKKVLTWQHYQTPLASISTFYDTLSHLNYYTYHLKQSNQKLALIRTAKDYHGFSSRGIRIGDPVSLVEGRYPVSHAIRNTFNSEFWVYTDLGLVFEIQDKKVKSWFLYAFGTSKRVSTK